jgi:ribosomal protein S18 acetylase RimI-like enzyme
MAHHPAEQTGGITPLFLRAARPEDYVACRALTNQQPNREGFGMFDRASFNDFAARQTTDDRYMLLVAEDDDHAIAGFVRALRLKDGSQTTIHALCRDFNRKGEGIGPLLISEVERHSRAHAVPRLFLKSPENTRAHKAYERMGFEWIGDEPPVPGTTRKRTLSHFEKRLSP